MTADACSVTTAIVSDATESCTQYVTLDKSDTLFLRIGVNFLSFPWIYIAKRSMLNPNEHTMETAMVI